METEKTQINTFMGRVKTKVVDIRKEVMAGLHGKMLLGAGAVFMAAVVAAGGLAFSGEDHSALAASFSDGMKAAVSETESCWALQINGANVAYVASEADGKAVLDAITARYQTEGSELKSVVYQESVEIAECSFDKEEMPEVMSVEDAASYVLTGTKETLTYTVQEGDTYWDIACGNGISLDELMAMNPEAGFDTLKVGTVLNLYQTKPFLHVTITEVVASTENIDYDITYEETKALYKGETQIKTAGVYGTKELKTEYVKTNGVAVSQNVVEETVISQPVSQVILTGTAVQTFTGSSQFGSPLASLQVSSAYGTRGGGTHRGVDLRAPKGTTISAMASGAVTYAGYSGTFGNIVKISHGSGWETWYAHCDTMSVSAGDYVTKGQKIGTVGMTGRATGYHLHLEVHKNGVLQNPMKYL